MVWIFGKENVQENVTLKFFQMTKSYLKIHQKKAKTLFNKAYDFQQLVNKNFGAESEIGQEALSACVATHRMFEHFDHLVIKKKPKL